MMVGQTVISLLRRLSCLIFILSMILASISFSALEGSLVVFVNTHGGSSSSSRSPSPGVELTSKIISKEEKVMLRGQIGSRPPRCERRCRSCGHCKAIQVPTDNDHNNGNARRQDYSDYKPMSWKCKCGSSIFNP